MPRKSQKKSTFSPREIKGARKVDIPDRIKPMLAVGEDKPFSRDGWIFEPKLDGIRAITIFSKGSVKIFSRTGNELTEQYPIILEHLEKLKGLETCILDGEIVALDAGGAPSFQLLQQRLGLTGISTISRAAARIPAYYYVFDIIYLNGYSLTALPLARRKEILEKVIEQGDKVKLISSFEKEGELAFQACVDNGFEGVVAKDLKGKYEEGRRSPVWIKLKAQRSADFVVAGYAEGKGARKDTFGSLFLGYYDRGELVYCGKVGSGFDTKMLDKMYAMLKKIETKKSVYKELPEDWKVATWVKPELVVEVKFMDWTEDMSLRHPVFLRVRDDLTPETTTKSSVLGIADPPSGDEDSSRTVPAKDLKTGDVDEMVLLDQFASGAKRINVIVGVEQLDVTSLDKILWAETDHSPAVSKGEFLSYLLKNSKSIIKHLKNRPLSTVRSPKGVKGRAFFQKHFKETAPEFIDLVPIKDSEGLNDYILLNHLPTLIWLGQNGVIEYHCGASSVEAVSGDDSENALVYPDYILFDFDVHFEDINAVTADGVIEAFNRTREIAIMLKDVFSAMKMKSFTKLSGRSGIHVYLPIERTLTYAMVKGLSKTISEFLLKQCSDRATVYAKAAKETGKVLIDISSNDKGKTIAAPYSPRIWKYPTVSMPVTWKELETASPLDYFLKDCPVVYRDDIWEGILKERNNLEQMFSK